LEKFGRGTKTCTQINRGKISRIQGRGRLGGREKVIIRVLRRLFNTTFIEERPSSDGKGVKNLKKIRGVWDTKGSRGGKGNSLPTSKKERNGATPRKIREKRPFGFW